MRANFYEEEAGVCHCLLCPHFCKIPKGAAGLCGGRVNREGVLEAESYGCLTSVALDPIEKKPLYMFGDGSILSIGSYGCNFHCGFCQNHEISFGRPGSVRIHRLTPEDLCGLAERYRQHGNMGVAYTYNEPFISYEYVYDCSQLVREAGMKNVLVTNGFVNKEPLIGLLPYIDALNIDLKGFTAEFYRKIGGDIEVVKESIVISSREAHVEVTTLVIPGENDSPEEVEALAGWLAGVDPGIPLHLTRFRPRHFYSDRKGTGMETVSMLGDIARKRLRHVFVH